MPEPVLFKDLRQGCQAKELYQRIGPIVIVAFSGIVIQSVHEAKFSLLSICLYNSMHPMTCPSKTRAVCLLANHAKGPSQPRLQMVH